MTNLRRALRASRADTAESVTAPKPPRRVRRLLAHKTKHQLAECLTPRYPNKGEQR